MVKSWTKCLISRFEYCFVFSSFRCVISPLRFVVCRPVSSFCCFASSFRHFVVSLRHCVVSFRRFVVTVSFRFVFVVSSSPFVVSSLRYFVSALRSVFIRLRWTGLDWEREGYNSHPDNMKWVCVSTKRRPRSADPLLIPQLTPYKIHRVNHK